MTLLEEISLYLTPPQAEKPPVADSALLGSQLEPLAEITDETKIKVALLGICESRGSLGNQGTENAPDAIRKYLYPLYLRGFRSGELCDLGNIHSGADLEDTQYAVKQVTTALLERGITVLLIGGAHHMAYAAYTGYERRETAVNVACIDHKINIGEFREAQTSSNFLGKLILHEPNYLFNYSHIGYQTYLVNPEYTDLLSKLFFDAYRLGQVRSQLISMEPVLRSSDFLSVDFGAVRAADGGACSDTSPNGFAADEICQLMYYAGSGNKLSMCGLFEYNPEMDGNGQSGMLCAQMIWCFLDGFAQRKSDFPFTEKHNYVKYNVTVSDIKSEIVFYKSLISDRWWMDVPYPSRGSNQHIRHHLVPCSYDDYLTAGRNELPDRWWQTWQKLQ